MLVASATVHSQESSVDVKAVYTNPCKKKEETKGKKIVIIRFPNLGASFCGRNLNEVESICNFP